MAYLSAGVIEFKLEPLTIEQQRKLREFLARPEISMLRTVVDSRCKERQVKALSESIKGQIADDPTLIKLSAVTMQEASKYQMFLNVLDEISNADSQLNTIKLT